jgi:small subunit ribosomal protein S8
MTDPIADFLTRVRNAIRAKHKQVDIPASNMKTALAQILYEQKFISGYSVLEDCPQGTIRIYLKYVDGNPSISGLQRVSTPGLRRYSSANDIPRTISGLGVTIVSTPKGVMTDFDARKNNVGGEILCRIW